MNDRECEGVKEDDVFPPFEYNITHSVVTCQMWDIEAEKWSQSHCKVSGIQLYIQRYIKE